MDFRLALWLWHCCGPIRKRHKVDSCQRVNLEVFLLMSGVEMEVKSFCAGKELQSRRLGQIDPEPVTITLIPAGHFW